MVGSIVQKRGEPRKGHSLFKNVRDALYWVLELPLDPYWLHLSYFVGISILGFLLLRLSHTRSQRHLNQLDAFYISVSAVTVTSLGTVRMQEFSEFQLVILTILMLVGGEVFTSILCLYLRRFSATNKQKISECDVEHKDMNMGITGDENLNSYKISDTRGSDRSIACMDHETEANSTEYDQIMPACNDHKYREMEQEQEMCNSENIVEDDLKNRAVIFLSYITLVYLVVVQLVGILVTILCFSFSKGREDILDKRGINKFTFCIFTIVSSFANCGFIPLDDSLLPFRKDSVLLITVALQVLLGNTMYAPCLRVIIWTLCQFSRSDGPKRRLYEYILKDGSGKLYDHLFPTSLSVWLLITVALAFGTFGWTRHMGKAGSCRVSVSGHSACRYLPPYPLYIAHREKDIVKVKRAPSKKTGEGHFCKQVQVRHAHKRSIGVQLEKLLFHDSCYLIIAVIVICITETASVSDDPLNYKIVNIVFEVVSAYGNVGISMGYSCSLFRKLITHSEGHCEEVAYSFSGKWSSKGKVVIILVMIIGRLKGIKRNSSLFLNSTAKIRRYIHRQLKIIKKAIPVCALRFGDHDHS